MAIETGVPNRSVKPHMAARESAKPNHAAAVNAQSLGARKNRLGESANGTRLTNS